MLLGLMYAVGHGFVVATLGVLAVSLGVRLPEGTDVLMERLVGVTLVLLGGYVFYTLIRHRGKAFRLKTRVIVLVEAFLWAYDWCQAGLTGVRGQRREIFRDGYGKGSSFVVGMIHGIGAETPTQLLLFFVTTGLGGARLGMIGVVSFVAGLLVTNTVMCVLSVGLYRSTATRMPIYRAVAVVTGTYSLVVGFIFVFGLTGLLPAM